MYRRPTTLTAGASDGSYRLTIPTSGSSVVPGLFEDSRFTLLVQICRVGKPSFCHSAGILADLPAGLHGILTIGRDAQRIDVGLYHSCVIHVSKNIRGRVRAICTSLKRLEKR